MDLTLSDIETSTMGELYTYAQKLGISAGSTWELKQKLTVEVMKKEGSIIDLTGYTEEVKLEIEVTIEEDKKRRETLKIYLANVKTIYNTIMSFEKIKEPLRGDLKIVERDDPLISFISNEMKTARDDFENMELLVRKEPNCSLLICGDSGAGKSSFINLLLNETLLPTSIRSNSSCQVRLTYGDRERAEIIDVKENKHEICKSEFTDQLSTYLENIEERKTVSCNSATIYLKSLILKGGLDIYDTIGLGETEVFNNELKKELNQITGIIFLLKRNSPIGDQTIGGLSQIIRQLVENELPWGSMNFIINMCDLLPSSKEKFELKDNVEKQLREKCNIINPQITTFSTKQELDFQKNDVMTTDYKNIIQLIQRLHISTINTNTVKVFSFLIRFVQQTIDQINELEKYSASDKEERKEYILNLRNLEFDRKRINQSFSKNNLQFLNNKKRLCRKKVEDYFHKEETKKTVVFEVISKQSELYGMTQIAEIDDKIDSMIQEEIAKSFKTFIEVEHILKQCCDEMLSRFIDQFAEHQKKKEVIHIAMNRHIDGIMNHIKCDFKDIVSAQSHNKGFLNLISPIIVPIVNLTQIVKNASWFSYIYAIFNRVNIHSFYEDTTSYVTKQAAMKYANYFSRKRNTSNLIDCLFTAPEQVTKDFEKYLSDDMDYLAKNIQSLLEDMRKKEIVFDTYKEIKEQLNVIYEELCQFSLLRLHKEKKHIMRDTITFHPLVSEDSDKIKPVLKGRNRMVYRGKVKSEWLCFMVFKNKDGKTWRDLYDEYKKHNEINGIKLRIELKELKESSSCFLDLQEHVIFHMANTGDMDPTFQVDSIDCSLNEFLNEKRKSLKDQSQAYEKELFDNICDVVKQILLGLTYLHSKSLCHYDLTGDSIGYSMTAKSVKLSSVSLPTMVKVKYEKNSKEYVLKMAHLPVGNLQQDSKLPYTALSDIYCLGILLYSMWLGIHPFYDVIVSDDITLINDFVSILKKGDLDSKILTVVFHHSFAHHIYIWCCRCRDGSITSEQFLNELGRNKFYVEQTNIL